MFNGSFSAHGALLPGTLPISRPSTFPLLTVSTFSIIHCTQYVFTLELDSEDISWHDMGNSAPISVITLQLDKLFVLVVPIKTRAILVKVINKQQSFLVWCVLWF
jgi:hypothetical protein